jgi:GxxExxY protein
MSQNPPDRDRLNGISRNIIGCAYQVSNTLGNGYLEKVYENALAYELRSQGLRVEQQYPLKVRYERVIVGEYVADLVVDESVLVELKAVDGLNDVSPGLMPKLPQDNRATSLSTHQLRPAQSRSSTCCAQFLICPICTRN